MARFTDTTAAADVDAATLAADGTFRFPTGKPGVTGANAPRSTSIESIAEAVVTRQQTEIQALVGPGAPARAETISVENIQVAHGSATVDGTIAAAQALGAIVRAKTGIRVTLASGLYLVVVSSGIDAYDERAYPQFVIRSVDGLTVLCETTGRYYRSGDAAGDVAQSGVSIGALHLTAETEVRIGARQQDYTTSFGGVGGAYTATDIEVMLVPLTVGGAGSSDPFVPSKANLYAAVKAILHPATQDAVAADDANSELDISGGGVAVTQILNRSGVAVPRASNTRLTTGTAAEVVANDDRYYAVTVRAGVRNYTLNAFARGRDLRGLTSHGNAGLSTASAFTVWFDGNGHIMCRCVVQAVSVDVRIDAFDFGLVSSGQNTPPVVPPTRYVYFGSSLRTLALDAIDHEADRLLTREQAAGIYRVSGIADDTLERLWWMVDEDLPQPVSWSATQESITAVISAQPVVTLDGRVYRF